MLIETARRLHEDEGGHATPLLTTILGAGGAIALAAGVVADTDAVTIVGGIALALGLIAAGAVRHVKMDYEMFSRVEALEER